MPKLTHRNSHENSSSSVNWLVSGLLKTVVVKMKPSNKGAATPWRLKETQKGVVPLPPHPAPKIKNKTPPATTERDKQKAMARNTLCTHNKQTE
jgi:hypothetical protein